MQIIRSAGLVQRPAHGMTTTKRRRFEIIIRWGLRDHPTKESQEPWRKAAGTDFTSHEQREWQTEKSMSEVARIVAILKAALLRLRSGKSHMQMAAIASMA